MRTISRLYGESIDRFFKNRGISITMGENAYVALDSWLERHDDGMPAAARFCAASRERLIYTSGSGRTMAEIRFRPNGLGVTADVYSMDDSDKHASQLFKECEAAETGRPYSRWETIQREWGEA